MDSKSQSLQTSYYECKPSRGNSLNVNEFTWIVQWLIKFEGVFEVILGGEMDWEEITRQIPCEFLEDEGAISVILEGALEMQLDEIWMFD